MVCLASCAGLGAIGCLSGDDTIAPGGLPDAGLNLPDTSVPVGDASGQVDGAGKDATPDVTPPPVDAGPDAADAGVDTGVDSGVDARAPDASGVTGAAGLVPGGSLSKSAGYVLNGTTGPASAPVLKSPKYRLVGGMAATTEHK